MDDLIYIDQASIQGLPYVSTNCHARRVPFVSLKRMGFVLRQVLSLSKPIHSVLSDFAYSYYVVFGGLCERAEWVIFEPGVRALRGASYLLQPGICLGSFVRCDVELVW